MNDWVNVRMGDVKAEFVAITQIVNVTLQTPPGMEQES